MNPYQQLSKCLMVIEEISYLSRFSKQPFRTLPLDHPKEQALVEVHSLPLTSEAVQSRAGLSEAGLKKL